MAYIDMENLFTGVKSSGVQVYTHAGATLEEGAHASTNVIDLGVGGDLNLSGLEFFIDITTAYAGAANTTVTFSLQTHDDADFGASTTIWTGTALDAAAGIAVTPNLYRSKLPLSADRYLRVVATVAAAHLSAGAYRAGIRLADSVQHGV